MIQLRALGQVSYEFILGSETLVIDPYLSNSVEEREDAAHKRLFPIATSPDKYSSVDIILITHVHRDHCDEDSLVPISKASPTARFVAPPQAKSALISWGIDAARIIGVDQTFISLSPEVDLIVVPSAHPTVVKEDLGGFEAVGYIIKYDSYVIYHAGDTCLTDDVLASIKKHGKIDIAFIPVNECNYMRDADGIIGNMSVREAFYFAEQIGATTLVPTHWDMFAKNQTYLEEIELLYNKLKPPFALSIYPREFSHA